MESCSLLRLSIIVIFVISQGFIINIKGAPLESVSDKSISNETVNRTIDNEKSLDDMAKSALMSSLPILRLFNSNKNFRVKFREPDMETTPTIHIINNLNSNYNEDNTQRSKGTRRFKSNDFDSILSGPQGQYNFGDRIKSRRIYPSNFKNSNQIANISNNTNNNNYEINHNSNKQINDVNKNHVALNQRNSIESGSFINNGSHQINVESESKGTHITGHDLVVSQGHEESKNKYDLQQPLFLNVTTIKDDYNGRNTYLNNNNNISTSTEKNNQIHFENTQNKNTNIFTKDETTKAAITTIKEDFYGRNTYLNNNRNGFSSTEKNIQIKFENTQNKNTNIFTKDETTKVAITTIKEDFYGRNTHLNNNRNGFSSTEKNTQINFENTQNDNKNTNIFTKDETLKPTAELPPLKFDHGGNNLQREINTLDVYSKISEIENILNAGNAVNSASINEEKSTRYLNVDTKLNDSKIDIVDNTKTVTTNYKNDPTRLPEQSTSSSSRRRGSFKYYERSTTRTVEDEYEDLSNQNYPKETIEKLKMQNKLSNINGDIQEKDVTEKSNINKADEFATLQWIRVKPSRTTAVPRPVENTNKNGLTYVEIRGRQGRNNTLADSKVITISKYDENKTQGDVQASIETTTLSYTTVQSRNSRLGNDQIKSVVPNNSVNLKPSYNNVIEPNDSNTKHREHTFSSTVITNQPFEYTTRPNAAFNYNENHSAFIVPFNQGIKIDVNTNFKPETDFKNKLGMHIKETIFNTTFNKSNEFNAAATYQGALNGSIENKNSDKIGVTNDSHTRNKIGVSSLYSNKSPSKDHEIVLNTDESSYYGSDVNSKKTQNANVEHSIATTQANYLINRNNAQNVLRNNNNEGAQNSKEFDRNSNDGTYSFRVNHNNDNSDSIILSGVSRTNNSNTNTFIGVPNKNIDLKIVSKNNAKTRVPSETTSTNDKERGSRKFAPTRFETISAYTTDSMTNKIYGNYVQHVKSQQDGLQSLEENSLSDSEKSKSELGPKPYRGSIKYKYEPTHYDWYDDDLDNSNESSYNNRPSEFEYTFKAANDTDVYQKGFLKKINKRKVFVVHGSYRYTAPDGTPIFVSYTADENGFHPKETKIEEIKNNENLYEENETELDKENGKNSVTETEILETSSAKSEPFLILPVDINYDEYDNNSNV